MNPGTLNRRIKFIQQTSVQNEYGGTEPVFTDLITTWGRIEPVRQYNQFALSAGASVLNGDVTLIIRFRNDFSPAVNMLFQDVSKDMFPQVYTIKAISEYDPGTKSGFQVADNKPYNHSWYIYIVGVKMDNSYQSLFS